MRIALLTSRSIVSRSNWSQDALPFPDQYYAARYNLANLEAPGAQPAAEGEYEAVRFLKKSYSN